MATITQFQLQSNWVRKYIKCEQVMKTKHILFDGCGVFSCFFIFFVLSFCKSFGDTYQHTKCISIYFYGFFVKLKMVCKTCLQLGILWQCPVKSFNSMQIAFETTTVQCVKRQFKCFSLLFFFLGWLTYTHTHNVYVTILIIVNLTNRYL